MNVCTVFFLLFSVATGILGRFRGRVDIMGAVFGLDNAPSTSIRYIRHRAVLDMFAVTSGHSW